VIDATIIGLEYRREDDGLGDALLPGVLDVWLSGASSALPVSQRELTPPGALMAQDSLPHLLGKLGQSV
jgi:hypothetical protein